MRHYRMALSLAVVLAAAGCAGPLGSSRGEVAEEIRPALPAIPAAKAADKAPIVVRGFDLAQVKLLDGPFKHAEELNEKYLLSLEPERMLYSFRATAGLPTNGAKPYGGWEDPKGELRGHAVGHYLSGAALAYRSSGNEQLRENAAKLVAGMAECQAKFPSGYLSAYPEEQIDRVVAGKPVWAPWYTLHKIYAGLLDQYTLCGNEQALEVLEKAIGWVDSRMSKLTDQQMQFMLGNEHGGMNEVLANLYGVTGNEKYLKLALRFNHRAVLDPAMAGQDKLNGLHANTQFPKFIGLAREYELTGEEKFRKGSEFFWNVVTKERSYVNGGNSDYEGFSPKEELSKHIGPNTTETCNTYNMLKLTRHLETWEPKAEYGDYYERGLFNHILAQQNPENGTLLYYLPLQTGIDREPRFGTFDRDFWCCTGTGMESQSKYGDSIYFHADKDLYVNLFIASELDWYQKGVKVRQETKFPDEGATKLTVKTRQPTAMTLWVRYPYWAQKGITIKVNGAPQSVKAEPGSFVPIARTWKSGDVVEVTMPYTLRFEAFRDDPNKAAVMYGPMVMAGYTTRGNPVSVIRGEKSAVLAQLKPVDGQVNTFTGPASIFRTSFDTAEGATTFVPYYKEAKKALAVYWDVFDEPRWSAKEAQVKAEKERQRILEIRRVDGLQFFDQFEREHSFKGEKTSAGDHAGRRWRHAEPGGYFQYDLKVLPDVPQVLSCCYWGSDGGRKFDILIDGKKIATQELKGAKPSEFFDVEYPIPAELLRGKEKVTVRFESADSTVGGVFGCYILKANAK